MFKKGWKETQAALFIVCDSEFSHGGGIRHKVTPTTQEAKGHSLPYSKEALVSSLYKTKKGGVRKPKPSQLQESLLYKAFGDLADIQGVEDESAPMLCFTLLKKCHYNLLCVLQNP